MKKIRKRHKRKTYYLRNSAQSKFLLRFVGISITAGLAAVAVFNYLAYQKIDSVLYSMRLPKISGGGLLWSEMLYTNIFIIIFTLGVFALTARALYVKVHGPLKKMTSDIERISEGNLNFTVVLRQKDEFRDLGDELNAMVKNFNERFSEIERANEKIKAEIRSCGSGSEDGLPQLQEHISQLENAVGAFKV